MFKVTLMTPKEELYVGLALKAVLPTEDGQLTILDFHQPLVTRLTKGTVAIDGRWLFPIKDGIARMSESELVGIVET